MDFLTVCIVVCALTLGFVFRDGYYAFLTTLPVVFTVAMQWMVMDIMDVELSLVTVMIGSILVGVGVDFSIHIANRVRVGWRFRCYQVAHLLQVCHWLSSLLYVNWFSMRIANSNSRN